MKNIPVFGVGIKFFRLAKDVMEYANRKKILKFLFELKDIPQSQRQKFVSKLSDDKEYSKVGESILLLLYRLDEINKATILGKLYKAAILEQITIEDFLRLSYIIERTFLSDLKQLGSDETRLYISSGTRANLYKAGLFDQIITDGGSINHKLWGDKHGGSDKRTITIGYKINSLGELLSKRGF